MASITSVPDDILAHIFSFIETLEELVPLAGVSVVFRDVLFDETRRSTRSLFTNTVVSFSFTGYFSTTCDDEDVLEHQINENTIHFVLSLPAIRKRRNAARASTSEQPQKSVYNPIVDNLHTFLARVVTMFRVQNILNPYIKFSPTFMDYAANIRQMECVGPFPIGLPVFPQVQHVVVRVDDMKADPKFFTYFPSLQSLGLLCQYLINLSALPTQIDVNTITSIRVDHSIKFSNSSSYWWGSRGLDSWELLSQCSSLKELKWTREHANSENKKVELPQSLTTASLRLSDQLLLLLDFHRCKNSLQRLVLQREPSYSDVNFYSVLYSSVLNVCEGLQELVLVIDNEMRSELRRMYNGFPTDFQLQRSKNLNVKIFENCTLDVRVTCGDAETWREELATTSVFGRFLDVTVSAISTTDSLFRWFEDTPAVIYNR